MGLSKGRRGASGTLVSAGALLGLVMLSWPAVIAVAIALLVAAYRQTDGAQRRRAVRLAREERRQQREDRELRVEQAGARSFVLDELADLVAAVTRETPAEAKRYELDTLLDRYADLLVTRRAYERQLLRPLPMITERTRPLQRLVRTRTLAWRQTCVRRVAECKARMDDLAALIRLYADRARTPEIEHLISDDIVGRQLA